MFWQSMVENCHSDFVSKYELNLNEIDEKYHALISTFAGSWRGFDEILTFDKFLPYIEEAYKEYESCFDMGFCDMSRNCEIAIKKIKERHYQGERWDN